jgi:hypothetical protein
MFRLDVGNAGVQQIKRLKRPSKSGVTKASGKLRVRRALRYSGRIFLAGVSRLWAWKASAVRLSLRHHSASNQGEKHE